MSRIRLAGLVALALVAVACGPRDEPRDADVGGTVSTTSRPRAPLPSIEPAGESPAPAEPASSGEGEGAAVTHAPAAVEDIDPTLDELDSLLDDLERMLSDAAVDEGDV